MLGKLIARLPMFLRTVVLMAAVLAMCVAQASVLDSNDVDQQPEVSFSLTRLPENPRQYSLAISDDEERSISGNFSIDQLQILRAIMTEAEEFALNKEAVGAKDPVTTRFFDKVESAFIVDAEKLGNQTKLYLTLKTEIGRTTILAGRVNRSTGREEGFYFDLLSRLESILPKLSTPRPK